MLWKDGSYYEGEFSKGKKHGNGRFIKDGRVFCEGMWTEGKFIKGSNSNMIEE